MIKALFQKTSSIFDAIFPRLHDIMEPEEIAVREIALQSMINQIHTHAQNIDDAKKRGCDEAHLKHLKGYKKTAMSHLEAEAIKFANALPEDGRTLSVFAQQVEIAVISRTHNTKSLAKRLLDLPPAPAPKTTKTREFTIS